MWDPTVLSTAASLHMDCTGKLRTSHCSALHATLGVSNDLGKELVYVLAGECHLQLHIANQVYQFTKSTKNNACTVSEQLAWLQQLDDNVLPKRLALGKVQDFTDWLGDVPMGYVLALWHLEAWLSICGIIQYMQSGCS